VGTATLPRRDRVTIVLALAGVTAIAWVYLAVRASGMSDQGAIGSMALMRIRPWTGLDLLLTFLMWAIMMVGMMVPTAAPMTLLYAGMARKAAGQATPIAPVVVFVLGYVVVWGLFSIGATLAQWGLEQAALLSPMMVTTSPRLGAALLVAAGLYQLTPIKEACLDHCRSPAHFIAQHWRSGTGGAFQLGLRHGAYCLGCCWVLMVLLFVGGVMNLMWIAGLAVFVLLEKVLPLGPLGGKVAGGGLIATGLLLLFQLGP